MEYTPRKFSGKHAQEIFSLIIHANRTVSRKLIRVLDNVKFEQHITTISGDVPWRDYQEEITEADLADFAEDSTLAFADATVTPQKIMAVDKFLLDDLRSTRFSEDMLAGAANITSNEFEQTVIAYLEPRLGKSYEKRIYMGITAAAKATIAASSAPSAAKLWAAAQPAGKVMGIVARMILAGIESPGNGVIYVAGATVTTTNLVTIYKAIHAALPTEVVGMITLFVPEGDFQLILQVNDDQSFKNKFTVTGGDELDKATVTYLGMKVEFLPINVRFAGRAGEQGDFGLATDLLSDATQFKIEEINNMSDALFGKVVAVADTFVLLPQQKVLCI